MEGNSELRRSEVGPVKIMIREQIPSPGSEIYPGGIAVSEASQMLVKSHDRPKLIDVAASLAIWAEKKPDCITKQQEVADTIPLPSRVTYSRWSRIGTTGACLIDSADRIRVVEASGWEHVALHLCTNYPQLIRGGHIVVSRQICTTCLRRLIQCGIAKVSMVQHDFPNPPQVLQSYQEYTKFFEGCFRSTREPPQDYVKFNEKLWKILKQIENGSKKESPLELNTLSFVALQPYQTNVQWKRNLKRMVPSLREVLNDEKHYLQFITEQRNLLSRSNVSMSIIKPTKSLPFQIVNALEQKFSTPVLEQWSIGCSLLISCRSQYYEQHNQKNLTQTHVGAIALQVVKEESPLRAKIPVEVIKFQWDDNLTKEYASKCRILKNWRNQTSFLYYGGDVCFFEHLYCGETFYKMCKNKELPLDNCNDHAQIYICLIQGYSEFITFAFYHFNDDEKSSCDSYKVISLGCNGSINKVSNEDTSYEGGLKTVHAEENLMALATAPLKDSSIYITHAPCGGCGRMLVGSGAKKVVYLTKLELPHVFTFSTIDHLQIVHEFEKLITAISGYFERRKTNEANDQLMIPIPEVQIESLAETLVLGSKEKLVLVVYSLLKQLQHQILDNSWDLKNLIGIVSLSINSISDLQHLNLKRLDVHNIRPFGQIQIGCLKSGNTSTYQTVVIKLCTAAALHHFVAASIVPSRILMKYIGVCQIDRKHYFVMQQFHSLPSWKKEHTPFEHLNVLVKIAQGLIDLRDKGMEHGNLKQNNVLMNMEQEVYLMDIANGNATNDTLEFVNLMKFMLDDPGLEKYKANLTIDDLLALCTGMKQMLSPSVLKN